MRTTIKGPYPVTAAITAAPNVTQDYSKKLTSNSKTTKANSMEKEIELLEKQLQRLKEAYAREEAEKYKRHPHKEFKEGDLVCNGDKIGIVGWTENKHMNLKHEDGYMGVDIITGSRGFAAGVKRDDWELCTDPYYKKHHRITVRLTGIEIEILKYHYGHPNFNPHEAKSKLYDAIDRFTSPNP